jgi:hypothetical protein
MLRGSETEHALRERRRQHDNQFTLLSQPKREMICNRLQRIPFVR